MSDPVSRSSLLLHVPRRMRAVLALIERGIVRSRRELPVHGGPVNEPRIGLEAARAQDLVPVRSGESFGPPFGGWAQRWFRIGIPDAAVDEVGCRHLDWQCPGEITVFIDGEPWAGLDLVHPSCPLPDRACELWLDCATCQTGIWSTAARKPDRHGLRFDGAALVVRDQEAWDCWWDGVVLVELAEKLLVEHPTSRPARKAIGTEPGRCPPVLRVLLAALCAACDAFDRGGRAAFAAALRAVYAALPAESWQPTASLVAHAHLDLVWLWPESEGRRKAVHTAATMVRLLERHPELRVLGFSPAAMEWIAEQAPGLDRQIRAHAHAGRWEQAGALWVESDTHLPCGEALARCLLLGQEWLRARTGEPSRVLWLPDCFGFNACLPQLMRQTGVDGLYTTKLFWSELTDFPHHSFVWRGHDGSEVVVHQAAGWTYDAEPKDLIDLSWTYAQAAVHEGTLNPCGWGDGGGGTTEAACERVRRLADLAQVPRARWTGVEAWFGGLRARHDALPSWSGELFLQRHHGCWTSQVRTKQAYRALELALQAWEGVRAAAGGEPLPERFWKRLCFAQFHDALPGTSIGLVHRQLNAELETLAQEALAAAAAELGGADAGWFNPVPAPRRAVVAADPGTPGAQAAADGGWIAGVDLPALGTARPIAAPSTQAWIVTPTRLANGRVDASFDERGDLCALSVDGQVVPLTGPAELRLHLDRPASGDQAWDIDPDVDGGARACPRFLLEVVEGGPVRAVLRGDAALGAGSRVALRYVLERDSPWLRIELDLDWQERERLLRYALPTAMRTGPARYGCPFGAVLRPQAVSTAETLALHEAPASRWAALSEGRAGLAVVTAASFGASIRDGVVAWSLLRGPGHPDPDADRGPQRVSLAVGVPGDGDRCPARAADALYAPVLPAGRELVAPFAWTAQADLVPAWALPDPAGGIVVRLHETAGARGTASLRLAAGARAAAVTVAGVPLADALATDADGACLIAYAPNALIGLGISF